MSNQAKSFRQGVNMYGKTQRFCHVITPAKSFIRLYSADQFKLAGGSRVKKVSISDNWKIMAGDRYEDKSYSTVYAYTTELKDPGTTKKIISSGVADYEPLVGGDEISLKQPIFYADEKKKAPDTEYYVEDPVNESLFPAPQITYSKVTETSNPENPVIVPNKPPKFVGKTGKIVHEFFTALDYPVEVSYTTIDNERDKSGGGKLEMLSNPLTKTLHDFAMASQGFSIELNNMSGMPKATWVYNENGSLVSGEESEYFKSNHGLTTIDSNGTIHRNSTLGLSVLHTLEGRHSYDQTYSSTANPNFNVSVPFFPVPIVVPLFSTVNEEKQFRSLVTNKTILRNGILKSQTVHSQSASITTENVAFDEITGEVLLTKTTNEFNDSLFSFKYPAWWKYAGMRPSYQNSKMLVNFANQEKTKKFLHAGDELRAINAVSRIWVKDPVIPSFITDDDHATSIGNNIQYIVYNSASKNLLSSPMGQIVTWKWNPILHGDKVDFGTENTLNSSVVEYDDAAVQYCETCGILANRLDKNDYLSGMEGNYKPWMTSFYLAERTSTTLSNGETNIRKEGLFLTYNDFWLPPPTIDAAWEINRKNWEWKEQVNLTDVDGQTIETQDRIERRSASLLGYRDNLVVAQAVNAGYGETYFDGFEDYYYSFCPPPLPNDAKQYVDVNMKRVQKSGGKFQIVENESHTGKYAISVASTLSFTIDPPKLCGGSNSNMGTTNGGTTWNSSTSPTAGGGGATHVTMPNPCISCVGGFNPIANKEYIFSAWVKVNSTAPVVTCADAFVMISAAGRQPVTLRSKGPVIEGWQLIQGKFSTPALTNEVTVTLNKGLELTYYDDLRIFPADGNMASYVYDDVNLKLTYTLDENNYFTKYEYNNQGELIRIKQETEDGIVTEKEGNNGIVKQ